MELACRRVAGREDKLRGAYRFPTRDRFVLRGRRGTALAAMLAAAAGRQCGRTWQWMETGGGNWSRSICCVTEAVQTHHQGINLVQHLKLLRTTFFFIASLLMLQQAHFRLVRIETAMN